MEDGQMKKKIALGGKEKILIRGNSEQPELLLTVQ